MSADPREYLVEDLMDDRSILTVLLEEAGALAETHWPGYWKHEVVAEAKSNPTDLVTAADRGAEAHIVQTLARLRPDDGILGEEGASRPSRSGRTWVIDPVDGTYNFVRGSERWCTAIALVRGTEVLLGGVYPPTQHSSMLAVGGVGISPMLGGEHLPPIQDRSLDRSALLTYLHPTYQDGPVGAAWRAVAGAVATLRMTGSGSLDALDVTAGHADLIVQHSVPAWDRYPGEALILAGGGTSAVVKAAGVEWYLVGAPSAVAEAVALLSRH